jgi:hypothetical protein
MTAFMCLFEHMKLDGIVLGAGSFCFVIGLIARWDEWHSQENRFRITSKMNHEKAKTASPEPNGLAL